MSSFGLPLIALFLSTPSARRATSVNDLSNAVGQFLSTPSARRATNQCCGLPGLQLFLSTPSARRATASCQFLVVFLHLFLSTPSARRATLAKFDEKTGLFISIHALREEGDDANVDQLARENEFLSTPSARRATP